MAGVSPRVFSSSSALRDLEQRGLWYRVSSVICSCVRPDEVAILTLKGTLAEIWRLASSGHACLGLWS